MLADGKARARSIASASWGWNTHASSERPSAVRRARPARKSACFMRCGPFATALLPMTSLAAHAAKAAAAGADQRLEHGLDSIAQGEIGEADDAGGDARSAVLTALAHRRDAGDELGLAHRPHLGRTRRAIHRVALEEHRRDDVVAGAEIGEQLVQEI